MARLRSAGTTTFLALLMSSTAVMADVTPEQVWDSWQKQYSAYGFTITPGSVARDGDVLTISDLVLTNESTTTIGTDKQVSKTVLTVPAKLPVLSSTLTSTASPVKKRLSSAIS